MFKKLKDITLEELVSTCKKVERCSECTFEKFCMKDYTCCDNDMVISIGDDNEKEG